MLPKIKTPKKETECHFLTGSRFTGHLCKNTTVSDGFGIYTFANGDEYRGVFKNGKFHGFGRMKQCGKNFILQGTWEDGKLKSIHDMTFSDGLICKGKLDQRLDLDASDWDYLGEHDRRYQSEKLGKSKPWEPPLAKGTYDMGQGVYDPSTESITKQRAPLLPFFNMSCPSQKSWTMENCRRGLPTGTRQEQPSVDVSHKIIKANFPEITENQNPCGRFCQFTAAANFELRCKAESISEEVMVEQSDSAAFILPQKSECNQHIEKESKDNLVTGGSSACHFDSSISHSLLPLPPKMKSNVKRGRKEGKVEAEQTSELQQKQTEEQIDELCEDLQDLIVVGKLPCAEQKVKPKPVCKRNLTSERKSSCTKKCVKSRAV